MTHKVQLTVDKFEKGLWSYHMIVPLDTAESLKEDGNKRVLVSIEGKEPFHAGLMPDGNGQWFIKLNQEKMKKYKLELGLQVTVELKRDESKYGMAIPEVFEELLHQDPTGEKYFEALTPGKKRSLIHMVSTVKSEDIKLRKALTILHHLKINKGNLDFKVLYEAMKNKNQDLDEFFR